MVLGMGGDKSNYGKNRAQLISQSEDSFCSDQFFDGPFDNMEDAINARESEVRNPGIPRDAHNSGDTSLIFAQQLHDYSTLHEAELARIQERRILRFKNDHAQAGGDAENGVYSSFNADMKDAVEAERELDDRLEWFRLRDGEGSHSDEFVVFSERNDGGQNVVSLGPIRAKGGGAGASSFRGELEYQEEKLVVCKQSSCCTIM